MGTGWHRRDAVPERGQFLINATGNVTLPSTQIANLTITDNHGANGQGSFGNGFYDLLNYSGSLIGEAPQRHSAAQHGARRTTPWYSTIVGSPNELVLQITVLSLNWTGLSGGTGAANSSWDTVSTNWSNNARIILKREPTGHMTATSWRFGKSM